MLYTECYDKIVEKILQKFPVSDDIDRFILCITVKIMIAMNSVNLDTLLVKPRDIYREVASKHFRIPVKKVTDNMITKIKLLDDISYNPEIDKKVSGWDEYFYNVCVQVARNTKCFSRRIGSILVYDKSIISSGYNGPPRGVPACDMRWKIDPEFAEVAVNNSIVNLADGSHIHKCPRRYLGYKSGEALDICPAGHAERNSLINAARNGIKTKDTSMYLTCGIPCTPCLVEIINAGVKEIIVTSLKTYDKTSMYLLNQSQINVRLFDFITI
jgi:dCMP deaminase